MRDKKLTNCRCEVCNARLPEGAERFCPPDVMEKEPFDKMVWNFEGCEPIAIHNFPDDRMSANRKGVHDSYQVYGDKGTQYDTMRYGGLVCGTVSGSWPTSIKRYE